MRHLLIRFLIRLTLATLLIGLATSADADPIRLGYERWTPTANLSGVIFGQKPDWYYGTYADKLSLVSVDDRRPAAPYRLIDIEMTPHWEYGHVMDAVWVENQGNFKTASWLLHGLSADDVMGLAKLEDGAILDLEAYEETWATETQYAVILRHNPAKFATKVLLNETWETLMAEIDHGAWRPIDVDVLRDPAFAAEDPEAWEDVRYNAVLVANSGDNFVYTLLAPPQFPQEIEDTAAQGLLLVDMEPMRPCVNAVSHCPVRIDEPCTQSCDSGDKFLALYVAEPQPFALWWGMTTSEPDSEAHDLPLFDKIAEELGRCIDVEGNAWNPVYNPAGRSAVFLAD